jgi:hypothetical protein
MVRFLKRLGCACFDGVVPGAVAGVASKYPPAEADDAEAGDKERDAHREPGRHPFTGEKDHACNLSANRHRVLRATRASRVLRAKK